MLTRRPQAPPASYNEPPIPFAYPRVLDGAASRCPLAPRAPRFVLPPGARLSPREPPMGVDVQPQREASP